MEEGFAIPYADEVAEVAGQEVHVVLEGVEGDENFAVSCGGLWTELRRVREDSFATLDEMRSDVDYERGTDFGEQRGVENFEWAEGFAVEGQSFQSCEEAAFVTESGGVVMIGVTGFPVRKNDSAGTELADHASYS